MATTLDTAAGKRLDRQLAVLRDQLLSHHQATAVNTPPEQLQSAGIQHLVDLLEQQPGQYPALMVQAFKELEAAYAAVELGQYGSCADCEGTIDEALLDANPCRQRCGDCQRQFDALSATDPRTYI